MGALFALLAPLLGNLFSSLLNGLFDAWAASRADADRIAAHENASVEAAARATAQEIGRMADAQNIGGDNDSPAALARRLRERAARDRSAGGAP